MLNWFQKTIIYNVFVLTETQKSIIVKKDDKWVILMCGNGNQ